MNKDTLISHIKFQVDACKNPDPNKELESLNTLNKVLLSQVGQINKKIEKIKKNNVKCPKCGYYFKLSKKKNATYSKSYSREETTFIDAGYGDDDRFATVYYTEFCQRCPKCNGDVPTGEKIRQVDYSSEHGRYGRC